VTEAQGAELLAGVADLAVRLEALGLLLVHCRFALGLLIALALCRLIFAAVAAVRAG